MGFFGETGDIEHLATEGRIRVTSSPEYVEHVCIVSQPREHSRLNLREVAHNELVAIGSHNRFA